MFGEKATLNLNKEDKLCPKLIDFKKTVQEDANKLGMKFNLTDSVINNNFFIFKKICFSILKIYDIFLLKEYIS